RGFMGWPTAISDSEPDAFRAWCELSSEDRQMALDEAGRYVEAAKATGRRHVCSYAVYLREKRWEKLPAKAQAASEQRDSLPAAPLGKMWGARVYELLLNGPTRCISLTAIEQGMVDSGRFTEEFLLHEKQAKQGFPAVNEMFERAASRRGALVPVRLQPIKDLLVQVRIGGEEWKAWEEYHQQRGWPWFAGTGKAEWAYFPDRKSTRLNSSHVKI